MLENKPLQKVIHLEDGFSYSDPSFYISVSPGEPETLIRFNVLTKHVMTKSIPQTHSLLRRRLPAVLKTTCFNDNEKPFSQEVKNTELGHLFEHILLEYLYQARVGYYSGPATIVGWTEWDWIHEDIGSFTIRISCEKPYLSALATSLNKSIRLYRDIITS